MSDRLPSPRLRRLGVLATAVTAAMTAATATTAIAGAPPQLDPSKPIDLATLSQITRSGTIHLDAPAVQSGSAARAVTSPSLSALSLDAPPIAGFTPYVVVGLTDEEQHGDDVVGFGIASEGPGGFTMPVNNPPHYVIATLDSGSQAHIFTYADAGTQGFNFASANRVGTGTQAVSGANGTEILDVSDGVGVYMTGVQNTTGGASLNPNVSTMRGQWNTPVLTTEQGSVIPNAIGSPILSQWQVRILNSQTRHVTVGSTTYRSPSVTLQDFNDPSNPTIPANFSILPLQTSDQGPPDSPYFLNLNNGTGADNPDSPGAWSSLLTNGGVDLTRGTRTTTDKTFLIDTGAQLSIISKTTAGQVGIATSGTNPTPPDFHIDVLGVGGVQSVPGFYLNNLTVHSNGDDITLNHVPVLVLNVADPRNPSAPVPGILGMNLFANRDLIFNTNVDDTTDGTYMAFGPAITPKWTFNGGGNWGDDTKWSLGAPDGTDLQANFTDAITSPATITVDSSGFTVGAIQFDNANRYTIAGPGTITLEGFAIGNAQINVLSGSHTISAPITLNSNTDVTITPAGGSLTLSGDMNGGTATLSKFGAGTLAVKHVRAGALAVNQAVVSVIANGTTTGTSKVTALTIAGGTTPTAKLDLTNNAMVIDYTGTSPLATVAAQVKAGSANGAWTGNGIASSTAAGLSGSAHRTAIGIAEDSAIGSPTSFRGQTADSTSLLLRYVYVGDSNLDGKVDTLDFNALAGNFGGSGKNWWQGDSNYDGIVDTLDFNALASNFGQSLPDDSALAANLVPEPSSIAALALAGVGVILNRRRRRVI